MLTHLYSLISKALQSFNPTHIPNPLQTRTSNIIESHQHSKKFGSKWANAISVISHIIDIAQSKPVCRNRIALNVQPKKWPHANTSTWDQIRDKLISEQLTAYSWKYLIILSHDLLKFKNIVFDCIICIILREYSSATFPLEISF